MTPSWGFRKKKFAIFQMREIHLPRMFKQKLINYSKSYLKNIYLSAVYEARYTIALASSSQVVLTLSQEVVSV